MDRPSSFLFEEAQRHQQEYLVVEKSQPGNPCLTRPRFATDLPCPSDKACRRPRE
jgi:hypothetical protein